MLDFEKWLLTSDVNFPYTKEDLKKAFYAEREMENPENIEYIKNNQHINICKLAAALNKSKK